MSDSSDWAVGTCDEDAEEDPHTVMHVYEGDGGIDVKTAMEAGDWRSANLFVGTYVHANEAGRSVAAAFDRETGPVGTELAQSTSGKRYRFGKKG